MRILQVPIVMLAGLICNGFEPAVPSLPFYDSEDFTPHWVRGDSVSHRIGEFSLTNQYGETVTRQTVSGKIYVANFMFRSCSGICPIMTRNLVKVQDAVKHDPDVLLLSHSVVPEMDTLGKLREYAEGNGLIHGKWHLVTGPRQQIYSIARQFYFADAGSDENAFLHTERTLLIDTQGRIRGVYSVTLATDLQRIIEDIATLKKEELAGNSSLRSLP